VLAANKQLARLFAVRETLYPLTWDPGNTKSEFSQFVARAEQAIDMRLVVDLERVDLLSRLYYATHGVVANLMNLLRLAALFSHRAGNDVIDLSVLSQAYEKRLRHQLSTQTNPFMPAFSPSTPPIADSQKPGESDVKPKKARNQSRSISEILTAR
jgi:hypothetical protein